MLITLSHCHLAPLPLREGFGGEEIVHPYIKDVPECWCRSVLGDDGVSCSICWSLAAGWSTSRSVRLSDTYTPEPEPFKRWFERGDGSGDGAVFSLGKCVCMCK